MRCAPVASQAFSRSTIAVPVASSGTFARYGKSSGRTRRPDRSTVEALDMA